MANYYIGPNAAQLKTLIHLWRNEHRYALEMARTWRLIGMGGVSAQQLKAARYARFQLRYLFACWHTIRPGQPIDNP